MVVRDDALERAERQVAEAEKRVLQQWQLITALAAAGEQRQADAALGELGAFEQTLEIARAQLLRERARAKSAC